MKYCLKSLASHRTHPRDGDGPRHFRNRPSRLRPPTPLQPGAGGCNGLLNSAAILQINRYHVFTNKENYKIHLPPGRAGQDMIGIVRQ